MPPENTGADYADTELLYNRVMEPALAGAVAALGLRAGWRVLDAGCGPGGVLPLLAAGVTPGGSVIGLDSSRPHVERARWLARERGIAQDVTVEVADLRAELPVAPASCDAVWTADVLYPDTVGDPAAVAARLARTLRPGGALAIFYGNWLRPMYLPGYARLEHLICAARETLYARGRSWAGTAHPERALAWLAGAGLDELQMRVFPVIHRQPLPDAVRRYISTAIFGGCLCRGGGGGWARGGHDGRGYGSVAPPKRSRQPRPSARPARLLLRAQPVAGAGPRAAVMAGLLAGETGHSVAMSHAGVVARVSVDRNPTVGRQGGGAEWGVAKEFPVMAWATA